MGARLLRHRLKAYDALAGRQSLGSTEWLSTARTLELLPGVKPGGLWGGVRYWDGQFDDTRYALLLARTAMARGALVVNHVSATGLVREGRPGARPACARQRNRRRPHAACALRGQRHRGGGSTKCGRWTAKKARRRCSTWWRPSQGVHLIVDRSFLPGSHALLVPKTEDGRVMFAVPWFGKTILGTTDTPREDVVREPTAFAQDVGFILHEAGRYLAKAPQRSDVRSVWVGLRPLVKPVGEDAGNTKALSREHTVLIGRSGLVTVTGGKWTTYRSMAEDVLEQAMARGLLPKRPGGVTLRLPLLGAAPGRPLGEPPGEHLYGSEVGVLRSLPGADRWLWRDAETGQGGLSEAMVRFAVRYELARDVEDVLARRCRLLFLDAVEAARQAPAVAAILSEELGDGFDAQASIAAFTTLAERYATLP